jgi:hypothetical protein
MKMVLRDPSGIKAGFFRVQDLLRRQAISFGWQRIIEKPCKKSQSLQIGERLHEGLRDGRGRSADFARTSRGSQINHRQSSSQN